MMDNKIINLKTCALDRTGQASSDVISASTNVWPPILALGQSEARIRDFPGFSQPSWGVSSLNLAGASKPQPLSGWQNTFKHLFGLKFGTLEIARHFKIDEAFVYNVLAIEKGATYAPNTPR
jgi:hypothetical protein